MKNLSVKVKMILLAIVTLAGLLVSSNTAVADLKSVGEDAKENLDATIRQNYDENIKNQVENVISLLEVVYARYQAGEYTLEEAKKEAAALVRGLRYGEGGYFWIDTYEGDNIVLLGSATEGTNRMETKDAAGYQMVKEIIRVGREPDGGFADYVFPKEGETESSPKRSYSKAFEPFEWVVGTGNYTDYIDTEVEIRSEAQEASIQTALILIYTVNGAAIFILMAMSLYIAGSISRSLGVSLTYIGYIAKGDFTQELPKSLRNRKDDFGVLGSNLLNMKEQISRLIREVKVQGEIINTVVDSVKTNVNLLSEDVDGVSATTQELAASMEETAASSETIKSMSDEIEAAAKNIAQRSQDGASQAADIHERAAKARKDTETQRQHAKDINDKIRESLSKALKEVEVVQQIEVLSSAIMEITNQTNLLALNASIEAARAGDAGRGFAVVATEIGGLADQSKQTVVKIQGVTEKVTTAVDNLSKDAQRLLEFVETDVVKSYEMFGDVSNTYNKDAEEIDSLISDFSAVSQELMVSIDSVSGAMNGIADATNEGARGVSDIADRSMDVKSCSETVLEEVEKCANTAKCLNDEISVFVVE